MKTLPKKTYQLQAMESGDTEEKLTHRKGVGRQFEVQRPARRVGGRGARAQAL